jgi:DNA-binding MarR family transcriptional regulator
MPGSNRATSRKTTAASKQPVNRRMPAHAKLSAIGLESSLGYSLRRAHLSTYGDYNAAMEPFDVRPAQFAVLMLIQSNPGLTQSAICTALGIQKTNFVSLLDKLETRGLTERRRVGGDRRSSALHLTADGEAFVSRMQAAHNAMEKGLTKRLGLKRTQELLAVLHEFTYVARHHKV